MGRANPVWSSRCGICPRIFQKIAGKISSLTSSVRLSAIPRGLSGGSRGIRPGYACWRSRAERRPDMFVCSLTFSRGVGRSQSNGLRSGCFTGLPRHGEPPECGSCRALAIGVRRRLPHVSRDAGRGRGITQSNRRGTRRGKGYFSPPNQWLALPKSGRTCSSPDKKRI